jgi:hypothetical protein
MVRSVGDQAFRQRYFNVLSINATQQPKPINDNKMNADRGAALLYCDREWKVFSQLAQKVEEAGSATVSASERNKLQRRNRSQALLSSLPLVIKSEPEVDPEKTENVPENLIGEIDLSETEPQL